MSKKAEYISKICEKLQEGGFKSYDAEDILGREPIATLDSDSFELRAFRWLPEENLRKMSEFDYSKYEDWSKLYQAFGREGFFNMKPFITTKYEENPSLVLRHNRFLHMFRGYYFQISSTVTGQVDNGHGSFRTDGLLRNAEPRNFVRQSKLYYMLLYAALIDCGFMSTPFINLFENDRAAVDEFLSKSLKAWFIYNTYTWDDIAGYFTTSHESIIPAEHDKVYEVYAGLATLCRFCVDKKSISVEYKPKGAALTTTLTLNIPDVFDGVEPIEDEDDKYDMQYAIDRCFNDKSYPKLMLLVMVLKLAGINLNWVACYAVKKLDVFPKLNTNETIEVNKLSDVKIDVTDEEEE